MDWYLTAALLLFGFGVVLLFAEFLLPTGGFAVVGGIGCLAVGVLLVFLYGDLREGAVALIAVSAGVPAVLYLLFSVWQSTTVIPGAEGSVAELPGLSELDRLKGRFGRALTPMRPAGAVEIDGRRIDAVSEGLLIDAGAWVRCVDVRAGRVVVRAVDPPAGLDEMPVDALT